jgi:YD repeat-containing protein
MVARVLAIAVVALTRYASCQDNPTDNVGLKPFGSYGGGNVDTIDFENGNVFLRIPLFSLPQLGKLSLSYSLILNNKGYTGQTLACDIAGDGGTICLQGAVRSTDIGPKIVADQFVSATPQDKIAPWSSGPLPLWYFWQVTDATGQQHTLGWDSNNLSVARDLDGDGYALVPTDSGYNAYTAYDSSCESSQFDAWNLYTASGLKYANSAACDSTNWKTVLSDPNGNAITFYPSYSYAAGGPAPVQGSVIDSVGRTVPSVPAPSSSTAGCPNLGVANQPAISSSQWSVPGPNGGTSSYLICYTNVGYSTDLYGGWESLDGVANYWTEANGQVASIQSVTLPDGTYWGFVYDSTTNWQAPAGIWDPSPAIADGDLIKLILPSGGSISYSYTNQTSCPTSLPNWAPDRFVQTRTVNDANGNSALWQYSFSGPNSGETTTETDPYSNDTQHIFTSQLGSQCSLAETTTKVYSGTASPSKTPMRTVSRQYYSALNHASNGSIVDILPFEETTTLENGQTSETVFSYPQLLTQQIEECYSSTYCAASTGSAIRFNRPQVVTKSGYGLASSQASVTNYKWQDSTSGFLANNWLTALASTCTPNAGYTNCTPTNADTAAYTMYGYDANGNVNATNKWLSGPTPQYITSSSSYTGFGALSSVTDPRGNVTQYMYDSSCASASQPLPPICLFPYKVQKPATSGISHNDYYTYDANSGNILTHVDQNASSATDAAHTTTYSYDLMGRLVDAGSPPVAVGSSTTLTASPETKYCYTDVGGSICPHATAPPYQMYTSTTASPDPAVLTMKQFDGLGRSIKSVLLSDPGGPQITDTTYDLLGRTSTASSAYRSKDDPTYDLVTYGYDSLGRKTSASHSGDGSSTGWGYSGFSTTFTDELSHQTTTTADALGRTISVVDPAGLTTTYSYDPLGNLSSVYQAGNAGVDTPRVRSFTYDSFSRLLCASNPESVATGVSCPSSAVSGLPSGALTYSYYWDGNLKTKTDANGVTQTNVYDALNRLTSSIFSNDSAKTPSTCYSYDGAASSNMIGRLAADWIMPYGSTCPSSPPTTAITAKKVLSYDAMGRTLVTQQCVLTMCSSSTPFQLTQTFDLAGNPTTLNQTAITGVIPQLELAYSYDGAGRLNNLASSWDGNPNSNDPINLFSAQSYSPAGIQNWKLGNYLSIQQTYDTRNRPTGEIVMHP